MRCGRDGGRREVGRQDLRPREPVDRSSRSGARQALGQGERQPVEVTVHQVEVAGTGDRVPDVQRLGDAPVDAGSSSYPRGITASRVAVVSESAVANSVTSTPRATRPSVSRLVTQLPRPVVAGRRAPGDRGEHGEFHAPAAAGTTVIASSSSSTPIAPARTRWSPTPYGSQSVPSCTTPPQE